MDVMMLCYSDSDGQHRIALEREMTSVGRSPDQDIVMPRPSVSRCHAVILREGNKYTVVDQRSTHGTFLNGERVQRAMLNSGDLLQLGSLNAQGLQFQRDDATTTHPPRASVGTLLSSLSELRPADEPRRPEHELERLNWLLRAARRLNQGGAIDDIVLTLLHLTLELTGLERGFVFLQSAGQMRLAHGCGADGTIVKEDSTVSRKAMRNAIESGSRFSVSDTQKDGVALDWPSIREKGIRSIYCIPLRKPASAKTPGQLLGLLYLDSLIGAGTLTEVDHRLLETIATEAAALVDHALLADEERKALQAREELIVAANIHRGLMSIAMPELPYAEIRAKTIPCLAIGGDFYDAVALDDCLCVAIADVSGKGVSAAIVAATLQGIIHAQFLSRQSLTEIATLLNHFLCTRSVGKYATMVLLKLFPNGELEYMNCGHVQPLAILDSEVRVLEESNLMVGLIPEAKYTSSTYVLHSGEHIFLPTDGLTEAEDPSGEAFGASGLIACAPCENVEEILERVVNFISPHPAQDDCSLLYLKYVQGA